jgi:Ca-activated chloride channel family protein
MTRLFQTFAFLLSAPLMAQGLLIGPDPQAATTTTPSTSHTTRPGVHITSTKVHAKIVDGVATTTIDQVIRNNGNRIAEGTWFLPLPAGAVADAFTMSVGGKEISGEVLDAGQARNVYESIVRRRRDPGLLEYAGEGMLRARIFPIPANGEVGVTVRLRQVIQPTGGMYEWSWPLRVARLGDAKSGPIGLQVEIESQTALSSVVTPHPGAEVKRSGEHKALVSVEGANGDFEDLRVLYGLTTQEFGLHLLPYRMKGEPGYFTALLSPPRTLADAKVPPRLVQLVVDTSGSMKGDKIQQAKASLGTFLKSLREEDEFQILTFSSAVQPFFEAPRKATAANVEAALARVGTLEAMGGTNIGDALQAALEATAPKDDGRALLPQIIFITDGQPTVGLTRPNQILELTRQADKAKARIFALGVGDQIDVRLLDDLVEQHRGARDFVGNKEKIEAKVDALCQKISRPALTDVKVQFVGLDAFQSHPDKTRDLFCGEMMQIVGRYRSTGTHTVVVTGKQNGVEKHYEFSVDFPEASAKHSFVQTLWARQHVASLLDEIRRNGQKRELITEVRSLATRYGIVTPYTSQLIVEEGMRLAGEVPQPQRRYRGPGDSTPRWGDRRGGRVAPGGGGGAATGGPSGPGAPAPSGPSTGGPTGAPAASGPITGGRGLADLGRARTGRNAVEESKALKPAADGFYLGSTRQAKKKGSAPDGEADDAKDRELIVRAVGRVFVRVGEDLVEQGLPKEWRKQVVVVEAFSKAYFELLKQKPALSKILALGERVVFRDGKRIVHVKPAKPVEPAKGGEQPAEKKAVIK